MKKGFNRRVSHSLTAMLSAAAFLICVYAAPRDAWARSGGITGYSGNPSTCTSCHSGGTVPTVTLTGPTTLNAGASGVYILTITGGAAVVGGLDVSTSGGTLQATGANTKLSGTEITHTASTAFSAGSLSFTFTAVAPSTAGSFTLYASGLSANGNGSTSGDNSAKTSLTVTVAAAPTAPAISLNPATLNLGTVTVGSSGSANTAIQNTGTANLVVSGIALCAGTSSEYTWSPTTMPITIAPGGSTVLAVTYTPLAAGSASGCLNVSSNDQTTLVAALNVSGSATTQPVTYNVTPSAGANGSLIPSTVQTVNANNTVSFTVSPNTGYQIASVSGCGGTLAGSIFTTGPVTANCTVSASFSAGGGTGGGTGGGATPVGYSPAWIGVTLVSLMAVGGFLLHRKKRKA